MNLSDFELLPGVVQTADDPDFRGRIKCIIPGIFDPGTMPDDTLPWVYPLCMSRYQSFTKLMKGSKVWVLNNTKNKFEYWYLPMFDYHSQKSKEYLSENYGNDPELIILRDNGGTLARMTYDDTNGYDIKLNEDYIQIKPGNKIEIKAAEGKVKIDGSLVYTGVDADTYEPCVLGNQLVDLLSKLQGAIDGVKGAAGGSPFTSHLAGPLGKCSSILSEANKILAKNTLLN